MFGMIISLYATFECTYPRTTSARNTCRLTERKCSCSAQQYNTVKSTVEVYLALLHCVVLCPSEKKRRAEVGSRIGRYF
jgi:hypothetical protein